jgi:hypothetical protein
LGDIWKVINTMATDNESARAVDIRLHAAVVFALAVARGALYSVRNGDLRAGELAEVLAGTSSMSIAKALGLPEDQLAIDWAEHLTREEREAIQLGSLVASQ